MKKIQTNDLDIKLSQHDDLIHVKLCPPHSLKPSLTDIICVLDISGSMGNEATVKNSEGVKESQGYSLLDILKHSVKTTIYNLSEHDRFGLVSFCDTGEIEYNLEYMKDFAKDKASKTLDELKAEGVTNLWDGLYKALEMLRKNHAYHRQQTIILLTDGEPNRHPPEGTIKAFENYQKNNPKFIFTLHTLALGKEMDSQLLNELAQKGRGQFSFIPCSGFMGTIFVNTFSNVMCSFGSSAQLFFEMKGQWEIESILGYKIERIKDGIPIGDIKFDQSQDFIIKVKGLKGKVDPSEIVNPQVRYYNIMKGNIVTESLQKCKHEEKEDDHMLIYHYCRYVLIEVVNRALKLMLQNICEKNLQKAQQLIKQACEVIQKKVKEQEQLLEEIDLDQQENHPLNHSLEMLRNLYKDISGEITLSFLKLEWFKQWGQHYLPSLLGCHFKQTCNNFKDPGIKSYGGELFKLIKQQTEDTFMKLPPPAPSLGDKKQQQKQQKQQQQQQKQSQQQQQQQQQVVQPEPSFADYYDACGGCFTGSSQICLQNGTSRSIEKLSPGDLVKTPTGFSRIKYLLKIKCSKPLLLTVVNPNLCLTNKHPILYQNQWIKPLSKYPRQIISTEYLYNLVIESEHQVEVGGVWCVSLGHGRKETEAVHPFFGSQKVVRMLEGRDNQGVVEVFMEQFVRNQKGQVVALKDSV